MNAEQARHLLAQAMLPDGQHARFRRDFTEAQRKELVRLGRTPQQFERLQRILPGIAYYCEAAPRMADVREHLADAAAKAHEAASSLRALLDAPECELARGEARECLLLALAGQRSIRYHEREGEARRLLAAIDDVASAADHARKRMPKAQTRQVAPWYPLALIDAALSVDGPTVPPSASEALPFREIVGVCYDAARVENPDPLRAIRNYLKERPSFEALLPQHQP